MKLAIYCFNFPNMDPDKILDPNAAWCIARDYLIGMEKHFYIGGFWKRELLKVKQDYRIRRAEYKSIGGQTNGGSPESENNSDQGGGLEQYEGRTEKAQKELGSHNESNDYSGLEDLELAETKLEENQESRLKHQIVSAATGPKNEARDSSEIDSGRTPSSASTFTSVNQVENPKASSATEYYPSMESHSRNYAQQSSHCPPPPLVDHSRYSSTALLMDAGFQHNTTYMPQQGYTGIQSDQGMLPAQYFATAYGPTQPDLNLYPVQQQNSTTNEKLRYLMENRGIRSGEAVVFTGGGSDVENFPSEIPVPADGYYFEGWHMQQ